MTKPNVFIGFDFEHDQDSRDILLAQDRNPDAPFQMTDCSLKELRTDVWKKRIRARIQHVDQVIFKCGERTNSAKVVGVEFAITREEGKVRFLIQGRTHKAS